MKKIIFVLVCCVALVGCKSDVGCVEGDCENGKGVYKDSKGNSYVGEYKDGLPNGKGVSTLIDGTIYDGEWVGGLMQGQGTKIWADGSKYIGEWKWHKKTDKEFILMLMEL